MMFGMYAKYFQEQNPKEGEFLTLVNPQCCDLWQFPGDENSGIFLKFEIGPLLHTRVCLHPFYPQIPLIRTEIAEKTDDYVQQISINPNINRKRSATIIDKVPFIYYVSTKLNFTIKFFSKAFFFSSKKKYFYFNITI